MAREAERARDSSRQSKIPRDSRGRRKNLAENIREEGSLGR